MKGRNIILEEEEDGEVGDGLHVAIHVDPGVPIEAVPCSMVSHLMYYFISQI